MILLQTELQAQTIQINQATIKLCAINITPKRLMQKFTDAKIFNTAMNLVEKTLSFLKESADCSMPL